MTTLLIILSILFVLIIGFVRVFKRHKRTTQRHEFAFEYREKFIQFTNKYLKTYDRWSRAGDFDNNLYVWLTKNVNRIQSEIGVIGVMDYIAPFQTYKVSNYQIIVNTLPKFRDGQIENFDVNSVDDCLLRYLGHIEERSKETFRNLRNPVIWFRIGFQEILSIPLFILNWFGIFSKHTVNNIMDSILYKIFTGIIALVTLISGIVTIIQGKEQTLELLRKLFGN